MRRLILALMLLATPVALSACVVAPLREQTFTLQPSFLWTSYRIDRVVTFPCSAPYATDPAPPAGTVWVGFFHGFAENAVCSAKIDYVFRGSVIFDLSPITKFSRHVVKQAKFSFTGGSYDTEGNGPDVGFITCVRDILQAEENPPDVHGLTPGTRVAGGSVGRNEVYVSATVQSWITGTSPNFGFVLVGADEGFPRDNAACRSQVNNFTLVVTALVA